MCLNLHMQVSVVGISLIEKSLQLEEKRSHCLIFDTLNMFEFYKRFMESGVSVGRIGCIIINDFV